MFYCISLQRCRIQTNISTNTQVRIDSRMNFFVVYSIVVFMVATISTANKVKKALEGATELLIGYSLEVRVPGKDECIAEIQGSITVSSHCPQTVVEYGDRMGVIVTATELLQGLDTLTTNNLLPPLKSEDIVEIKRIDSVQVKGNNSTTPLFGWWFRDKDIYLVDVSGIEGVKQFKTYDLKAVHKVYAEAVFDLSATIVSYMFKIYAAPIHFSDPGAFTFEIVIPIERNKVSNKITFENQTSTGCIQIRMK